jgi:hypothetical protein
VSVALLSPYNKIVNAMKTVALFILLVCACAIANAAVLTVSNNVLSPAQYTNIAAAMTAAASGDSIYVHGTPTGYGNITIDKQLYFIGTGHHPNKQLPFKSILSGVQLTANAGGTVLDGFVIGSINGNITTGLSNITIRHCEVTGFAAGYTWGNIVPMNNWLIENCIFRDVAYFNGNTDMNNWILRNNIFYHRLTDINGAFVIDHNLFYGLNATVAFQNVNNSTISNNVFYMMAPSGAGTSTFLNNITYNTSNDVIPYGSNGGSNNIVGQDPLFVNFPAGGGDYSVSYNYHLQPSSPGAGTGSDGQDIGPEDEITEFSMSGEPWIPQVRMFNILNTTVPVGGVLNVTVTVTKAEDH